jgi:type 1 glutamine amidotransferase
MSAKKLSEYKREEQLEMLLANPDLLAEHDLKDYTPDEQNRLDYTVLCALRRKAYSEHVATMDIDPKVKVWAAGMEAKHGPKVRVHVNPMPWIEALLVVRYGEAVGNWPAEFSEKDIARAVRWAAGEVPQGVKLIEKE